MPAAQDILEVASVVAFLWSGMACLCSARLVAEFERYRVARFRVVVGWLEIAGAAGIVAGRVFAPLGTIAAAGLAALMVCGLWTRWRIRDPWYMHLPAFALGLINGAIVVLRTQAQV